MLLFLKEFSQRMVVKTHEIEKQVDTLVSEARATDTRVNNVYNDFLMLSNIQFVENVSLPLWCKELLLCSLHNMRPQSFT